MWILGRHIHSHHRIHQMEDAVFSEGHFMNFLIRIILFHNSQHKPWSITMLAMPTVQSIHLNERVTSRARMITGSDLSPPLEGNHMFQVLCLDHTILNQSLRGKWFTYLLLTYFVNVKIILQASTNHSLMFSSWKLNYFDCLILFWLDWYWLW
jgi:hypothetical protein